MPSRRTKVLEQIRYWSLTCPQWQMFLASFVALSIGYAAFFIPLFMLLGVL